MGRHKQASPYELQRVDKDFVKNLERLYPFERSVRERTRKLNKLLDELVYGKT